MPTFKQINQSINLRDRLLEKLLRETITNVTTAARELHVLRPSLSRLLSQLQKEERVIKTEVGWELTQFGRKELIANVTEQLTAAQEAVSVLVGNVDWSGLVSSLSPISSYFASSAWLPPSLFPTTETLQRFLQPLIDVKSLIHVQPTMLETFAQVSGAISPTLSLHLASEALVSALQGQTKSILLLGEMASVSAVLAQTPTFSAFGHLDQVIGNIIGDLGEIIHINAIQPEAVFDWIGCIPSLTEVIRTHTVYLDEFTDTSRLSLFTPHSERKILLPAKTTALFTHTIRLAAEENDDIRILDYAQQNGLYAFTLVDDVVAHAGSNFLNMWHGCWNTLHGNGPDDVRQAATSGRELLMQLLAFYAPDEELMSDKHQQPPTRQMRVRHILKNRKRVVNFVESAWKLVDDLYDRLSAGTHDRHTIPHIQKGELAGYLLGVGQIILLLFSGSWEESIMTS